MLCSTYVKWFPAVLHDKRLGCAIGLLFGFAKCKMWNAKCKVRNGLLQYCVRRGRVRISGGSSCPMQNAKCKMWQAKCKIQSTKWFAALLHEKRFGENLWLRHLAQLTFHLHSSCLSCSCTTVSLMLDVQGRFFLQPVWRIHKIRKGSWKGTYLMGYYGHHCDYLSSCSKHDPSWFDQTLGIF